MKGNRVACLSLAALFAGVPAAAQVDKGDTTARELVRIAIERNRDFLALRQRMDETRGLLRQAGVRPVPTVEIEGSTGRPLGTVGEEEYSAGYFHVLETSGKRDKRVQVARKSLDLAESEISERIRQLSFEIKTRYVEALAEKRKLEAIDRLIAVNRESFRLTEVRVSTGDAAPLEAQLLLTELNRAGAQREVLLGRLEGFQLDLRRIAGMARSDPLPLDDRLAVPAAGYRLEELQERAARLRPDLRIARLLEEQAAAEAGLADAQAHADLTLSARYSQRNARFDALRDRDHIVTFGVAIPLQTRKRNQGNIDAAASRVAAARLRREYLEAAIPLEAEAAYQRWSAARRYVELLDRGVVGQSEKNLEVIRQAYNLGQLRVLDVLNEQRRLIETQLAYIDAQADQFRAFAELERAVGGEIQ
jgi:cobalt-zinc-cadmium efflux system outer membrane protein